MAQTIIFKSRDKDVKAPAAKRTLFDIKNQYFMDGRLDNGAVEELFELVDFLTDRLIYTESERFRNNF